MFRLAMLLVRTKITALIVVENNPSIYWKESLTLFYIILDICRLNNCFGTNLCCVSSNCQRNLVLIQMVTKSFFDAHYNFPACTTSLRDKYQKWILTADSYIWKFGAFQLSTLTFSIIATLYAIDKTSTCLLSHQKVKLVNKSVKGTTATRVLYWMFGEGI